MALWLSENEVDTILRENISEFVTRFDDAYRDEQTWDSRTRTRFETPFASYQYMGGVVPGEHVMGLKTYAASRNSGFQGVVVLFDYESGNLLSVMGADVLGRWRTGAASAVAAKYFAKRDAVSFGLIGTGNQAVTQLAALKAVCNIAEVRAYSRDVERREAFCQKASENLGISVEPADSAHEVVAASDIIATVTSAREIVLQGSWIDHPCHINAVGANRADQQELDTEVFKRADLVIVDNLEQAREECGDLISAVRESKIGWDDVVSLRAAITQNLAFGLKGGVTIFESQGLAAWDLVAAQFVYSRGLERNLGIQVPLRSQS